MNTTNKIKNENEKIEKKELEIFKNEKINIIPLIKNEKNPAVQWKLYQEKIFSFDSLTNYYNENNYGAICGSISDNLVVIDFDLPRKWKDQGNLLTKEEIYELYKKIVNSIPDFPINTLIIKTASGGLHFYFKLDSMEPYLKLEQTNQLTCNFKLERINVDSIDVQGEGKYVVIPPSSINNNYYEIYNQAPILKITEDNFNLFLATWTNSKIENEKEKEKENKTLEKIAKLDNVREPFKDIVNGKFEIESYAKKYGIKEFLLWDGLFREYFHNAGLEPKNLYNDLTKNQPNFDIKKTETQLKYHPYIRKPFTNKKLKELFPDYEFINVNEEKKKSLIDESVNELYYTINFNQIDIEIRKKGIYEKIIGYDNQGKEFIKRNLILDGRLEILFKVYDTKLKIERFSFLLNEEKFNTLTIPEILRKINYRIYYKKGPDIIKRIFNYFSDEDKNLPIKKPEYVLGFNNGWKLPYLESENDYAIVCYTDIDEIIYNRARKIIKSYSEKEKQSIIEKLNRFIKTTQTNKENLMIVIFWSMTAPFRLPIIDFLKIAPILYNHGERRTGKGSLEEFWIINFYGVHEKLLPSKTLESPSRLEDYCAASTFPIAITEADGHNIKNTFSIIKELPSDNTDFERKKSAKELEFRKTKTAGICLDSNIIIKEFEDSALNSKLISNEFKKYPKIDFEWKKIFRELSEKKLFSFMYEYTKSWTNKDVFEKLEKINNEIKEDLKEEYDNIEEKYPRIINIYIGLLFGLDLFENSFNITLDISKKEILETLTKGRKIASANLIDTFYEFCLTAIDFTEDSLETRGSGNYEYQATVKAQNPKYLTCKLEECDSKNHEDYYAFTNKNLRDFNEFISTTKYSMSKLFDNLQDGIIDKNNLIYSNCRPFENQKMIRIILINKNFLFEEDSKKIIEEQKKK